MDITKLTLEQLTEGNPKLVEGIQHETKKAVLSEVEEKMKKGEEESKKYFALGKKLSALSEAGFPAEVSKSVRKMIERDDVTVDGAKALIEAQGEVIKAISVKPAGNPKVKGSGTDQEIAEEEKGQTKEVSSAQIREALVA